MLPRRISPPYIRWGCGCGFLFVEKAEKLVILKTVGRWKSLKFDIAGKREQEIRQQGCKEG